MIDYFELLPKSFDAESYFKYIFKNLLYLIKKVILYLINANMYFRFNIKLR